MTQFWIIAAGLMALAMVFIVPPLVRRRYERGISSDDLNLMVFRQQLRELEDDLASGILDREQFEAAKIDLEKELLVDVAVDADTARRIAPKPGTWAMGVISGSVPLLAVVLYQLLGSPTIIAQLEGGETAAQASGQQGMHSVQQMIGQLVERLERQPDDPEGWLILGRSYVALGRIKEAVDALERAYKLSPQDPMIMLTLADNLATLNGSRFAGRPRELVTEALRLAPQDGQALWMMGWVHFQAEEYAQAIERWQTLAPMMEPGGQDAEAVFEAIQEARSRSGSVAGLFPAAGGAADAVPAAASQSTISVEVALSPELAAQANPDDRVFVFARALQGPPMPLAAVSTQVKALPSRFELDDSMAMNPQFVLSRFDQVRVGARVSKSGNALPQAGDLEGEVAPVSPGADAIVKVVIDRVRP